MLNLAQVPGRHRYGTAPIGDSRADRSGCYGRAGETFTVRRLAILDFATLTSTATGSIEGEILRPARLRRDDDLVRAIL